MGALGARHAPVFSPLGSPPCLHCQGALPSLTAPLAPALREHQVPQHPSSGSKALSIHFNPRPHHGALAWVT